MSLVYPHVTATTFLSSSVVIPGGEIAVSVQITGDTRSQSIPVPTGVVLLLDMSGSMKPYIDSLHQAAISFLNNLTQGQDEAAIVIFHDGSRVVVGPTSDINLVRAIVPQLLPAGMTNIAAGFSDANALLRTLTTPIRFGLLFTDGVPFPNDIAQRAMINNELKTLAADLVTYHTVGLGAVDEVLLDKIARQTGGTFSPTADPSRLTAIFQDIYEVQARKLTTKDLAVVERINSRFSVKSGSLELSTPAYSNDQAEFDALLAHLETKFYASGELPFPHINELGASRLFSYKFILRADGCNPAADEQVPLRAAGALVTYLNGNVGRQSRALGATQALTVLRCGVHITKVFDEEARVATIGVHNSLTRPIREVHVGDILTPDFGVGDPNQVVPPPATAHGNRISWDLLHVLPQSTLSLRFPVLDRKPPGPMGTYRLQVGDSTVHWLTEESAFILLPAEPDFLAFQNDLNAAGGTSVIERVFMREMTLTSLPIGATVTAPPPEVSGSGFEWQIDFTSIALPPRTPGSEALGRFYVMPSGNGYEIFQEFKEYNSVPVIDTSASYKPR